MGIVAIPDKDAIRLFHEGARALGQVEANGMRIDVPLLEKTIEKVSQRIRYLTTKLKDSDICREWRKRFGLKFNLDSRVQLGTVIYDVLQHPVTTYTASGRPATDEATLEKLDMDFVRDYLEVAKLRKLRNTNLRGIQKEVVDGLLHPFFHLHTVSTFRGSSSEINFQNLPNRNPKHAKLVRRLFVPRPGHVLLEVDLKANEVRIACSHTKDPQLIHDTLQGDMHRDMAAECYMLPKEEVPKDVRLAAKGGFVFAEFYGDYYGDKADGTPGVARNLWDAITMNDLQTKEGVSLLDHLFEKGITRLGETEDPEPGTWMHHIKSVEDNFWNVRYRVYNQWKRDWVDAYNRDGFFRMKTGFVVRSNKMGQPLSRNEVTNSPIQGSAFHCLLWVLVSLQKWLVKNKMKTLMIGQIHDSIELDCHQDELQDVLDKVFSLIRRDIQKEWDWLIVPLEGEAEVAETNWYEKKEIEV